MSKDIVLLINRSEITAGTRGASLGPGAIFTAARKNEKFVFGNHPIEEIKDVNYLLDSPTQHKFAKRIDGLLAVYNALNKQVATLFSNHKFLLVLAADPG